MKTIKPIILALAFSICLLIISVFVKIPKREADTDATVFKSQVHLIQNYQTCGHIVEGEIFESVSYSSEDELKRRFEGYQISSSDNETVVLSKNIKSYCPAHFIAVLKNNKITVSKLFDGKKVAVINTNSLSMSEHEKKLLSEGFILHSEEALTAFIEDFTS